MKSLSRLFCFLFIILLNCCNTTNTQSFSEGKEFSFEFTYLKSSTDSLHSFQRHFHGELIYLWSDNNKYRFYNKKNNDSLVISISGLTNPINLIPNSNYEVYCESHVGWPSTFGLIIKSQKNILFEGITDWGSKKNNFTY